MIDSLSARTFIKQIINFFTNSDQLGGSKVKTALNLLIIKNKREKYHLKVPYFMYLLDCVFIHN